MRPLRRAIIGCPLPSFFRFLIGFEHEVTVNYERAGTESTTNFELPVDRLCSSLCHCGALPNPHRHQPYRHQRRPNHPRWRQLQNHPLPTGKRDANELSVTIVDRTDAMHGFFICIRYTRSQHASTAVGLNDDCVLWSLTSTEYANHYD